MGEAPAKEFIDVVFHELSSNAYKSKYKIDRTLLKNEHAGILNEKVIDTFPGKECIFIILWFSRREHA